MFTLLKAYKAAFSNLSRNVWLLAIAMLINRSGSMVLLFTSLYMTRDLHFSIKQAGLVMSFYGIGSVLGSYLGGWLTDRWDYRKIMIGSLLMSSLILFSLLIFESPLMLSIIIFVYALMADSFRPANSKAISIFSNTENRTRSVSLIRLAINLGFSIGPAIGGFIAIKLGYSWLFVIDALTGIGAAALLFFYLPKIKNSNKEVKKVEVKIKSPSAYKDYAYLIFVLLVALYGMCFFQLFASVPQFFATVCNYTEDTIGLFLALNGLLVVVIEMPLVAYLEKFKNNFKFIILGTLCLPVAFSILVFGKGAIVFALLYTLIITLSEIFAMPFMMNFALSRPKEDRQGQYSALYSIGYGLSNIAAPAVGLWVASNYGFNVMFYVLIGISILVALGFWLVKKI